MNPDQIAPDQIAPKGPYCLQYKPSAIVHQVVHGIKG